mmetsp:Transcript_112092/g.215903  ORF Transcript_112092/g.215903 Transcript_112092/m.215903 type:complete len:801 (+) Transcript_112092:125-2527(+)
MGGEKDDILRGTVPARFYELGDDVINALWKGNDPLEGTAKASGAEARGTEASGAEASLAEASGAEAIVAAEASVPEASVADEAVETPKKAKQSKANAAFQKWKKENTLLIRLEWDRLGRKCSGHDAVRRGRQRLAYKLWKQNAVEAADDAEMAPGDSDDECVLNLLTPEKKPAPKPKKKFVVALAKALAGMLNSNPNKEVKKAFLLAVRESGGKKKRTAMLSEVKGAKFWRGIRKDRPSKNKVSDAELAGILDENAVTSSRWHHKLDKPMMVLTSSKRQIHKLCLSGKMSRGWFFKRIKQARLGHGKCGQQRTDCCEVCQIWDVHAQKQIAHEYNQIMALVQSKEPDFFLGMPAIEAESSTYLEGIRSRLKGHTSACTQAGCELCEVCTMAEDVLDKSIKPVCQCFGHHFYLRDELRSALKEDETHPQMNTLYMVIDYQTTTRLPRGPWATSQMWYAGSVLGLSNLGAKVWGHEICPQGLWVSLVSRVLQHDSCYSVCCLEEIFSMPEIKKSLDSSALTKIVVWADTGVHFRSSLMLGAAATHLLTLVAGNNCRTSGRSLEFKYGLEGHMKSVVDGLFGTLCHYLDQSAQTSMVSDAQELVACYRLQHAMSKRSHPSLPDLICKEFWPMARTMAVKLTRRLSIASLPGKLKACHAWEFKIKDRRLRNTVGANGVLTGCKVSCRHLPSSEQMVSWTCKVLDTPEAEEGEDDMEHDEDEAVVSCNQKDWNGWKISYRKTEAEKKGVACVMKRLEWKKKSMSSLDDQAWAGRHKRLAEVQANAASQKAAKKKKDAESLKALKE